MTISVELPKESAAQVMKALEFAVSQLEVADNEENALRGALGDAEEIEKSEKLDFQKRQANALVHMAKGFLSGNREGSTADHYQVVLHVDERVLRGEANKSEKPAKDFRDAHMKNGSTRTT